MLHEAAAAEQGLARATEGQAAFAADAAAAREVFAGTEQHAARCRADLAAALLAAAEAAEQLS